MEEKKKIGFLEKILSLFMNNDPEAEKKRQLKEIAKALKKQRYKFYRVKDGQALPLLAKFFHEIYKNISPAQVFLENAKGSSVLRMIVIDSFLSENQLALREKLSEEYLKERSAEIDTKVLASELKSNLVSYYGAFSGDMVANIEKMYALLVVFTDFTDFDYYFLLKKFDSNLSERDFAYNPKFEAINGDYISEDLKDFLELTPFVRSDLPWDSLFDILKNYKNTEVIDRSSWKKVLRNLLSVEKEKTLLLMVRYIDQDPEYTPKIRPSVERIVEDHLNKIKAQAEINLQKIIKGKKAKQIDALLMKIFGTTAISRMNNYTDRANIAFSKKMLGGFTHIAPANYLKAFLLDYYKRDIKRLADILLIKGKWVTQVASQQMSESFHAIMDIAARLVEFDASLSEEGERGQRLKLMLNKPSRDKNSVTILRRMLGEINDIMLNMLTETARNMVVMGRSLKAIVEDAGKKDAEMIINWKELEDSTDGNLREEILEVYKKIYYFVQLLQFFTKKK